MAAAHKRTAMLLTGAILLGSLALFDHGRREWRAMYVDDSFITLRYAENWAAGHGPVFNPGERVEGYSNPAWMAVMAGGIAVGIEPIGFSRMLGIASAGLLILALYLGLTVAGVTHFGAALTTLLVSSCQIACAWSGAGLETLSYSLFLFVGLVLLIPRVVTRATCVAASSLLCLAALSRPEGVAFWLGGAGFVALFDRRRLPLYLLPGASLLLHLAWRYGYYGELLPNTYYARISGSGAVWRTGLRELRNFLIGFDGGYLRGFQPVHLVWFLAATGSAIVASRWLGQGRRVLLMGVVVIAYLAYIVSVGGDSLLFYRYQTPILAPLAYLVGLVFTRSEPGMRDLRFARWAVALLVCAVSYQSLSILHDEERPQFDHSFLEGNAKLGQFLAEERPPDTLIAVVSAGAIPYFSRLPTIDMLGLSDRHIARLEPDALAVSDPDLIGHMKFDIPYVLSRRPDIIVIIRGYFPKGHPHAEYFEQEPLFIRSMSPLHAQLIDHVYFHPDYELRALDLGDGSRFYVFERRVAAPDPGP